MRDEFTPPTGLAALYDDDFYVWCREQARALHDLGASGALPDQLDWLRLAEEIDSLGRRDLRGVESLTRQILVHLMLLAASGAQEPRRHWIAEIVGFRIQLRSDLTPTLRRLLEAALTELHADARVIAAAKLAAYEPGRAPPDPALRWSLAIILCEADDPLGVVPPADQAR